MKANLVIILLVCHTWALPKHDDKILHPNLLTAKSINPKVDPSESTSSYWIDNAQRAIREKIGRPLNQNVAKNVILFLGDGMSVTTVAASRVYLQGEEAQLSFDKFPYIGLSKTYAVDRQVADSANTATAYLCGVKANYGTIGVGPEIKRASCTGMTNVTNHALSIAYYSQLQNKRTGLVTTARVTHASPGGVYAHTADRNWECDSDIIAAGEDPNVCMDIGTQLVHGETGKNLNVIMGGGRAKLLPKGTTDDEGDQGSRSDDINLIDQWLASKTTDSETAAYVWNRDQLLALDNTTDNLMGIFASDHMDYNLDRDQTLDPSLAEMTEAAIKILSKGENGYFLFVEGARIDMGHHAAETRMALDETIEFSKAIQTAADLTSEEDTLIVVTSDHSHTLSYGGYAERGHDILEFAGTGSDGRVYTTLNYANGPGYKTNDADGIRHDITQDDYKNNHYKFPAVAPLDSESHGGEDVAIFARGPWAHLFSGVNEQNIIPHLMSFASCVGEGLTACAD